MKFEVGMMVKPGKGFAENGVRLWNDDRTQALCWFEIEEIGCIVDNGPDTQYVKVLTSSGNVGWALSGLLIQSWL